MLLLVAVCTGKEGDTMPGLLENCERYFGSSDLYTVLGVRRTAGEAEVRRGYHKTSLKVHPDRVSEGEKDEATLKFQVRAEPSSRGDTPLIYLSVITEGCVLLEGTWCVCI